MKAIREAARLNWRGSCVKSRSSRDICDQGIRDSETESSLPIDCFLICLICLTMPYLALRTDKEFAKVRAVVDALGYGGFAVREVAGDSNEHWHWLLEGDKELKVLRNKLTRSVPEISGNGAYSLTLCRDVEKYERYLCKGESEGAGVDVAWRNSLRYDDAKVEELHSQYWAENRKIRKRTAGSMIDRVVDEAKRKKIEWSNREQLAKVYIRMLADNGKPINLYSVRSNLNAVQVALCPDDTAVDNLCALVSQC